MAKTDKSHAEKRREMAQRPDTDPYEVLGVARDANDAAIKRAYRDKAKRYHPDKNKSAEAEERFKEVAEAFDVLSDPEKRALFDLYGNVGPGPEQRSRWRAEEDGGADEASPRHRSSQPARPRRHMDDWENVYVGDFNGVPHFHFGPVKACAGCGLGFGEMGPVDEPAPVPEPVVAPERRGEGGEFPSGMAAGSNDTLPGAATFRRAR